MSELKPGEYVGADGMIHTAEYIRCRDQDEYNGDWFHIGPFHRDFPAAAEALKALVLEPFEWEIDGAHWLRRWNGKYVEKHRGGVWTEANHEETAAFEAGRRYERERGHADE